MFSLPDVREKNGLKNALFPIALSYKMTALLMDSALPLPFFNLAANVFIALMLPKLGPRKVFFASLFYELLVMFTMLDDVVSGASYAFSLVPSILFILYPFLFFFTCVILDFAFVLGLHQLLKAKIGKRMPRLLNGEDLYCFEVSPPWMFRFPDVRERSVKIVEPNLD